MADVEVSVSGPIFDGRAIAAGEDMCDAIRDDLAAQGYADWMGNLNASIVEPTPYYETQITTDRGGDTAVVHDRGIVYGPWLEGTGSRNRPRPGFPGYWSRRRAVESLQRKAQGLAERVVARYIGRMG